MARTSRTRILALLAALLPLAASAQSSSALPAQAMSFDAALKNMNTYSDRLAASRNAVESTQLRREGLQGLGGPSVSVSGAAYAYNANLTLDLDPVNQSVSQAVAQLPPALGGLVSRLPQLPDSYTLNRHGSGSTASLTAVWPIYVGGASNAARGLAEAQTSEAEADAAKTGQELTTLLVQRYFGAQLAERAATLRENAFQTIEKHDAAAQKMLAAGVISRLERLQAQSALEDARRQALKARDDAELAATALTRTVKAGVRVLPSNPLFVLSQPVEPLPHFVDAALTHHPGLSKVAAKKSQAEQLHAAQEALRKPQVFAFGQREIKNNNGDWIAGIGVRWTLWDSIDRNALAASSTKQIEQAERTGAQARDDIALLVEKNWQALEQARRQYLAMAPSVALADEMLRLRDAGLREGTSTTLDLIDAQVNQAKVQTERAQAAHDYVKALADLLESCGLSEEFGNYMARADVKVQ
jgi:outer membrane protein TolC